MRMDFSNLPQLQIDRLIKPISRRLLRNQPFFPFVFHGSKLFRDTQLREKGTPCWDLTPHTNTVLFLVNRDFASTAYLLWMHFAASCFRVRIKWLCAAIYLLFMIFKNAVVGFGSELLPIAVFIGLEDSDGAGRGCVSGWQAVCVCGSLLQHHVVKSLLVSTRRWAQLIPRPGWGESEVNALGTSPLSPTFFCLLKALYLAVSRISQWGQKEG